MAEPFKTYEIGGRKFTLRPTLKLGQTQGLMRIFKNLMSFGDFSMESVVVITAGKIHEFLAYVLNEDGIKMQDVDREALAEFFRWELDDVQGMEIVRDFFECAQMSSLLNVVKEIWGIVEAKMQEAAAMTKKTT